MDATAEVQGGMPDRRDLPHDIHLVRPVPRNIVITVQSTMPDQPNEYQIEVADVVPLWQIWEYLPQIFRSNHTLLDNDGQYVNTLLSAYEVTRVHGRRLLIAPHGLLTMYVVVSNTDFYPCRVVHVPPMMSISGLFELADLRYAETTLTSDSGVELNSADLCEDMLWAPWQTVFAYSNAAHPGEDNRLVAIGIRDFTGRRGGNGSHEDFSHDYHVIRVKLGDRAAACPTLLGLHLGDVQCMDDGRTTVVSLDTRIDSFLMDHYGIRYAGDEAYDDIPSGTSLGTKERFVMSIVKSGRTAERLHRSWAPVFPLCVRAPGGDIYVRVCGNLRCREIYTQVEAQRGIPTREFTLLYSRDAA